MEKIRIKKVEDRIKKLKFLRVFEETAREQGLKLFIVGGYVRDILLEREQSDIDFLVVDGDVYAFAQKSAEKLKVSNVHVYKNYGTAHFVYGGFDFEFVGARKESYRRESRKPQVETGTFEDDISRRDFTINTLAVSLNPDEIGVVYDLFNGLSDIEKKLIKTPLDPFKTFDDDPLRILRAFRFASQLQFNVAPMLLAAAEQMRERLKIISQERITDELFKILSAPKPSIGLKLLYETKVLEIIFPEVAELAGVEQRKDFHHKDVFWHTLQVVDNIAEKSDNVWLRFAGLMHDIAKPRTKKFIEGIGWTFHGHEEIGARMMKRIFRKLKLPMNKLEYVEKLVRLHLRPIALVDEQVTDSAIRRLIVAAGEDLDDLITLCRADITSKNPEKVKRYLKNYDIVMQKVRDVKEKDKLRAFQSPVRGDEIMRICNIPPSRTVGKIKKAIEEAILEGEIPNTYEAAYEYLLKIKDKILEEEKKENGK
jgi:tRNA nucleotidyltransferase (CCA-adding enzyme)